MCILTAALETLDFGLFFTGEMAMNAMEPGYPRLVFAAKSRIEGCDYGVEISPTGRVMFRTLAEAEAYKESISWLQFAADLIDGSPAVAAGEYEETAPSPASAELPADPPAGFEPVAWWVSPEACVSDVSDGVALPGPMEGIAPHGWRFLLDANFDRVRRVARDGEYGWWVTPRVLHRGGHFGVCHQCYVIEPIPAEPEPTDVAATAGEEIDASFEVVEDGGEADKSADSREYPLPIQRWQQGKVVGWGVLVDAGTVVACYDEADRDRVFETGRERGRAFRVPSHCDIVTKESFFNGWYDVSPPDEEPTEAKPVGYPRAIDTDIGDWRWGVLVDADKVIPFKVKDSRDSLLRKLQANPAHYVSDYFARSREDFLAGNADQRPRREKPEQPVAAQPAEAVAEPEPEPEPKYAVVEGRGETGSPSWGVQLAADKTSPVAEFGGGEDGRSCADNAAKNMNSGEGPLFDSYVPMAAADFYGKAAGFVYKESARKVCGKLNAGVMRERDIPCWRDIDVAAIDISELDEGPDDASQAEA